MNKLKLKGSSPDKTGMRLSFLNVCRKLLIFSAIILALPSNAGDEFAIFDGRVYNGRFYPRIDIIEWTNPGEKQSHMEFQIYSKSKPVDIAVELETKTGRNVMLVRYHLKDRNEYVCRRVLAPGHFKDKFFVYKDVSDHEMDNFILTMDELPTKPGMVQVKEPAKYMPCEEEGAERKTASTASTTSGPDSADKTQNSQVSRDSSATTPSAKPTESHEGGVNNFNL